MTANALSLAESIQAARVAWLAGESATSIARRTRMSMRTFAAWVREWEGE